MQNKVFEYYTELPPWAKGVVVVGGVAIAYFTARGIYSGIKKIIDNRKQLVTIDTAKSDLTDLSKKGTNPSLPDSQFATWADAIQAQFDGCDVSAGIGGYVLTASGKTLFDITNQLKNDADFLKLVTAYGVRTYAPCLSWFNSSKAMTLPEAVADELSTSEIAYINGQMAAKGIKYTF